MHVYGLPLAHVLQILWPNLVRFAATCPLHACVGWCSDHVAQPFEPFLDWNDFGVWIAEADLPDVETILRGFTPQQKAVKMVSWKV